jgi:uncharacterized protein (DUF952 family)
MDITFHLVSLSYFESTDPAQDYSPAAFSSDGFIHCTDDRLEMARIANEFYAQESPPHVYLYIDKTRVASALRYDDPERRNPHIYGPLNRDAIIAVRQARRDASGCFLPPDALDNASV